VVGINNWVLGINSWMATRDGVQMAAPPGNLCAAGRVAPDTVGHGPIGVLHIELITIGEDLIDNNIYVLRLTILVGDRLWHIAAIHITYRPNSKSTQVGANLLCMCLQNGSLCFYLACKPNASTLCSQPTAESALHLRSKCQGSHLQLSPTPLGTCAPVPKDFKMNIVAGLSGSSAQLFWAGPLAFNLIPALPCGLSTVILSSN
jgi:hypothetical protein